MFQTLCRFRPAPGRVVLPDVCCDVTFLGNQLNVSGPLTQAQRSRGIEGEVVLLRIAPADAYHLLRVPIKELTNCVVRLDAVNRSLAHELERAYECGRLTELVRPIHLAPADRRFQAAAVALGRGSTVRRAAAIVGLSERQLERLFHEHAGLAPKTFARIVRLRRTLIAAQRGASLALSAATHGYADQAHFSRDVRAFTCRSPGSLLPNVGSVQDVIAGEI
jgi:AraC-like DNA-binding protein